MVCASLRNSIPKSVVYCQVREAKRGLLDHFFTELGKKEARISMHPSIPLSLTSLEMLKHYSNQFPIYNYYFFSLFFQLKQLGRLLDEDPAIMQRRSNLAKRLELYRSAQEEIDAVAWSK